MPLTDPDGTLTVRGESLLIRALLRGCCSAPVRNGETEQEANDEILRVAEELNAEQNPS